MKNVVLAVFATALYGSAMADQASTSDPLVLCEVAGAAYGAQKDFVASVAARQAEKAGLNAADSKCGPIWREAFQIGRRASQGKISTQAEMDVALRLSDYEAKVIDAVIKNMAK